MPGFIKTINRITASGVLCLALAAGLFGCQGTADDAGPASSAAGESTQVKQDNYYKDYDAQPYAVRTVLKEYAFADPDTGTGFYGRYTVLKPEGNVPETFRKAAAEYSRRAEEAVMARADQVREQGLPSSSAENGYRYITYGYILTVTRADETAFSILETEFEKGIGQADSEITYHFRGSTFATGSGEEIALEDLAGDEASWPGMLKSALSARYGTDSMASADPSDYAWIADALGIRFYFNSDAVSKEKRRETGDYTARAVCVGFAYADLPGEKAEMLSAVPEAYIAMAERETTYDLPHGDMSVTLMKQEDAVVLRIRKDSGESSDLVIEYADDLSDFYIIRAEGGFYLFRERIGYQEGFFYDFSRPDGGFGRFAYNTSQYFDSFLREILTALPYNPYCVHMAEVRRSFGASVYDRASFIPHGHYTFPNDPKARYKRFLLTDSSLQIDAYNTVCRLLEDLDAAQVDGEGNETGRITVPAGKTLLFESCDGEASRYDDPPGRNRVHTYFYTCLLTDGTRIRFESSTESVISVRGGYMNRFTEPVSLGEVKFEDAPGPAETFTVRIGGKDYPLIPDYSRTSHTGEEIDFGEDTWWLIEGYPGRYRCTDEDMEAMKEEPFAGDVLPHPDGEAELRIAEDGSAVFDYFGTVYKGDLPEKRRYKTDVQIFMESKTQRRTFRIILREGEDHTQPVKIMFYSEGEPATNEPSKVPPLTVYLTRIEE
ncbi:MAG: hypothetical protein K6G61_01345 [Solobacterium sp.]|nr:hypothetical protein [Solobacterium sp.]